MLTLALVASLAAGPAIVRSFDVDTYASEPQAAAPAKPRHVVLWSLACEPASTLPLETGEIPMKCVPAKLQLPAWVPGPNGATANGLLRFLGKCYGAVTEKAPDNVVALVSRSDEAAVAEVLAKQTTPTVVVVARLTWDGSTRNFDVSMSSSPSLDIAEGQSAGRITVHVVDAPGARKIARAIDKHHYRTALALAQRAFHNAHGADAKVRTAGNLAVAAMFANDKGAVPQGLEYPDDMSEAASAAVEAIEQSALFQAGGFTLVGSSC